MGGTRYGKLALEESGMAGDATSARPALPPGACKRQITLRIMQQIQSIAAESPEQPLFWAITICDVDRNRRAAHANA